MEFCDLFPITDGSEIFLNDVGYEVLEEWCSNFNLQYHFMNSAILNGCEQTQDVINYMKKFNGDFRRSKFSDFVSNISIKNVRNKFYIYGDCNFCHKRIQLSVCESEISENKFINNYYIWALKTHSENVKRERERLEKENKELRETLTCMPGGSQVIKDCEEFLQLKK